MTVQVVCRAHKTDRMKTHAFYYYHTACWDARDHRASADIPSEELSSLMTPVHGGYIRLLPLEQVEHNTICIACRNPIRG